MLCMYILVSQAIVCLAVLFLFYIKWQYVYRDIQV